MKATLGIFLWQTLGHILGQTLGQKHSGPAALWVFGLGSACLLEGGRNAGHFAVLFEGGGFLSGRLVGHVAVLLVDRARAEVEAVVVVEVVEALEAVGAVEAL